MNNERPIIKPDSVILSLENYNELCRRIDAKSDEGLQAEIARLEELRDKAWRQFYVVQNENYDLKMVNDKLQKELKKRPWWRR